MKLSGGDQSLLGRLLSEEYVHCGEDRMRIEDFTEVPRPQMDEAAEGADLDLDTFKALDRALRALEAGPWKLGYQDPPPKEENNENPEIEEEEDNDES